MILVPIHAELDENRQFLGNPLCNPVLQMTVDFFKKVGYVPPWIGYFVTLDNHIVGSAAFKGPPVNNSVEIAYGTFGEYQHRGIGTKTCRMLVELALKTDNTIQITARTLPEKNYSTKILEKNGFILSGTVNDPEDGDVWEWIYPK